MKVTRTKEARSCVPQHTADGPVTSVETRSQHLLQCVLEYAFAGFSYREFTVGVVSGVPPMRFWWFLGLPMCPGSKYCFAWRALILHVRVTCIMHLCRMPFQPCGQSTLRTCPAWVVSDNSALAICVAGCFVVHQCYSSALRLCTCILLAWSSLAWFGLEKSLFLMFFSSSMTE